MNGAESEPGYQPKNALLQRVEELKEVKGWEKFTARPDWDADFTLYSTGPIDLVWASRDVLLSLPGFNEQIVDRFLELRRGPDGIDGTDDDPDFESLDQVRLALGFTPEQFAQLSGLIGFNDPVMRVVSVGKSGNVTRTVADDYSENRHAPDDSLEGMLISNPHPNPFLFRPPAAAGIWSADAPPMAPGMCATSPT